MHDDVVAMSSFRCNFGESQRCSDGGSERGEPAQKPLRAFGKSTGQLTEPRARSQAKVGNNSNEGRSSKKEARSEGAANNAMEEQRRSYFPRARRLRHWELGFEARS